MVTKQRLLNRQWLLKDTLTMVTKKRLLKRQWLLKKELLNRQELVKKKIYPKRIFCYKLK